jgi:chromosome segregation ATPase
LRQLHTEHEELEIQLQQRVKELRAEEAESARLRLALAEQKARAESLSGVLGTTEADLVAERERTAELEAALAASEARVAALRRDVAALDATVAERETTIAQLQESLAATQEAGKQAGIQNAATVLELENQLTELQETLSNTQRDLANRVRQHRGERARADAAEKQQQATLSDLGELRTKYAELEQNMHTSTLELRQCRSDLGATQDELSTTKSELVSTSSELASTQTELTARLLELDVKRAEATAQREHIDQLETTVEAMMDTIRERAIELAAQEARWQAMEEAQAEEVAYLAGEIGELRSELSKISTQLAAKIRQHRRELARAEGAEANVAACTAEYTTASVEQAVERVVEQVVEQELRQRLIQTTAALEGSQGTLATLYITLGAMEGELAMKGVEITELETVLTAAWEETKKTKGVLANRELMLVERKETIERLESEAALTDVCWAADRASHMNEVAVMKAQMLGVQEDLHSVGRQLTAKIRQHRKETARAEEAEGALVAAKEALAAEERLALRSKIQTMGEELAASKQREATLQSAVNRAEARCMAVMVELESGLAALRLAGGEKQKFEESADMLIASMHDGFAEQRYDTLNVNC